MIDEEAYGRAWRCLARLENHRKGAPRRASGVHNRPEKSARRAKVAALMDRGMTLTQISAELGITKGVADCDRAAVRRERALQ